MLFVNATGYVELQGAFLKYVIVRYLNMYTNTTGIYMSSLIVAYPLSRSSVNAFYYYYYYCIIN